MTSIKIYGIPVDLHEVTIPCGECEHEHSRTLEWLTENSSLQCLCGKNIDIAPNEWCVELDRLCDKYTKLFAPTI